VVYIYIPYGTREKEQEQMGTAPVPETRSRNTKGKPIAEKIGGWVEVDWWLQNFCSCVG